MISPISNLTNMEYMLYGNTPSFGSSAAPSISNGYYAAGAALATAPAALYPYYSQQYNSIYNNQGYDQYIPSQNSQQTNSSATGISQNDLNTLVEYNTKKSSEEGSESFLSAATTGALMWGFMENPRLLVHPINSAKTIGKTNEIFKACKNAHPELWKNQETNEIMREAYFRMHKTAARTGSKLGFFRKRFTPDEYQKLEKIMKDALATGNPDKIAEATAKIQNAYISNGKIPSLWKKIRGKEVKTVEQALADTQAIDKIKGDILKNMKGKTSFMKALKRGGGVKGALLFAGMEFLMDFGNIGNAFSKDSKTGWKQLGQTTVKGVGTAAGFTVGQAAGVWAASKIGAKIGTAVAPGIGTLIGGAIGVLGASLGNWLGGKIGKKIAGNDAGVKVGLENKAKTPEGQLELLQLTMNYAQKDKNLDPRVALTLQNIYSAVA